MISCILVFPILHLTLIFPVIHDPIRTEQRWILGSKPTS